LAIVRRALQPANIQPGTSDGSVFEIRLQRDRKGSAAVRYSLYDISSPNARNVGALNDVSRGTRVADRDHVARSTM